MSEFLTQIWASMTLTNVLIFVGAFVFSILLNIVVIAIVFIKIPANYFSSHYQQDFLPDSSWHTRWGAFLLKNLAGLIMIVIGVIALVGPGQGILSILTGLILLDIPGKRPIEARLIGRPTILSAANKLRARYNKPPLLMD
jgi:hypothetical protein